MVIASPWSKYNSESITVSRRYIQSNFEHRPLHIGINTRNIRCVYISVRLSFWWYNNKILPKVNFDPFKFIFKYFLRKVVKIIDFRCIWLLLVIFLRISSLLTIFQVHNKVNIERNDERINSFRNYCEKKIKTNLCIRNKEKILVCSFTSKSNWYLAQVENVLHQVIFVKRCKWLKRIKQLHFHFPSHMRDLISVMIVRFWI